MTMRDITRQQGFTLPELLVAGGVMAILVVISALLIHPADYGPRVRDAQRTTDVAQMAQALNRYVADNGKIPDGITDSQQLLGSEKGMLNLCAALVPKYLKDLPSDPAAGGSAHETLCDLKDPLYSTGYTIKKTKNNQVVIEAPVAEAGEKISQTRAY